MQFVTTKYATSRQRYCPKSAMTLKQSHHFNQNAYFDVLVTNASAASHANKPLKAVPAKYERAKKSKYNHRIMNIEHGTFTPLIFTASGCMGPECSMSHRSIADKISEKMGESYADVISFI